MCCKVEIFLERGQFQFPIYINASDGDIDALIYLINVFESYDVEISTSSSHISNAFFYCHEKAKRKFFALNFFCDSWKLFVSLLPT